MGKDNRYERIYLDDNKKYISGFDVIICAQSILKDSITNRVIGQVKYQNVSTKTISAMFINVVCYDVLGNEVERIKEYQYLDIKVSRDEFFGSQTAIILSNANIRKIVVEISRIIYSDDSICDDVDIEEVVLDEPIVLSADKEIMKQATIEFGEKAKYKYKKYMNIWTCTCGAVNHESEESCHVCDISKNVLEMMTLSYLEEKKKERYEEIARDRELKRIQDEKEKEKNRKVRKKVLRVVIPILVFLLLVSPFIYSEINYRMGVIECESAHTTGGIEYLKNAIFHEKPIKEYCLQLMEKERFKTADRIVNACFGTKAYEEEIFQDYFFEKVKLSFENRNWTELELYSQKICNESLIEELTTLANVYVEKYVEEGELHSVCKVSCYYQTEYSSMCEKLDGIIMDITENDCCYVLDLVWLIETGIYDSLPSEHKEKIDDMIKSITELEGTYQSIRNKCYTFKGYKVTDELGQTRNIRYNFSRSKWYHGANELQVYYDYIKISNTIFNKIED